MKIKQKEIINYMDFLEPSSSPHYIMVIINNTLFQDVPNNSVNINPVNNIDLDLLNLVKASEYGPITYNITKDEVKQILTNIYKVIFNKDTSLRGLADLAVFMRCNPNLHIDRYIQSTSSSMRSYVEEGLNRFTHINITQLKSAPTSTKPVSNPLPPPVIQPAPLSVRNRSDIMETEETLKKMKEYMRQNNIPLVSHNISETPTTTKILSTEELSASLAAVKELVKARYPS